MYHPPAYMQMSLSRGQKTFVWRPLCSAMHIDDLIYTLTKLYMLMCIYFYSFGPPKYSGQSCHEIKESDALKDSALARHYATKNLLEPSYDLIDSGQKPHSDIRMTSNPAYDISNAVKMEDNPAYSLSGNKVVESDYM